MLQRIDLENVGSTNSFARQWQGNDGEELLVVARYQTAGRGSGRNTWESAPGENLLFSLAFSPRHLMASASFALSEALALSVCEALQSYADGFQVKWPNDIYHTDRKVAGLLIENELAGARVRRTVMGVGLNVNQSRFLSDAPNPVSLCQLAGSEQSTEEVLQRFLQRFGQYRQLLEAHCYAEVHRRYLARLYRLGEEHEYVDAGGHFRATITGVEPSGHLLLTDENGSPRRYAFKEVSYVLGKLK